jgi:hypothetical protein
MENSLVVLHLREVISGQYIILHKDVNTKSTCVFVISGKDKWSVRAMDI